MPINNRGMQGQPTLPYVDYRSYAGASVFADFTFLDRTGAPAIPVSVQYQLDDLTNNQNMIPITSAPLSGTYQLTIQLPGSQLQMSNNQWNGSQICQLLVTAVLTDSIYGTYPANAVAILELCSIQTPAGY